MHIDEFSEKKIKELLQTVNDIAASIDIPSKKQRMVELEKETQIGDFWSDQDNAKKIMQELESIRKEVTLVEKLTSELEMLLEFFQASSDHERLDLKSDFEKLSKEVSDFEIRKYLNGRFDRANATLSIHAGQGGTEATDWTAMLARMYERYFERKGWKFSVTHKVPGTEVGFSSIEYKVEGDYAFGLLKREQGAHRLVRLSPFNSANLRQTSFAGVEVAPIIEEEIEIQIEDKDIEFKAVRSGGAGGQHVNKTSSAVQIKHIPTGITVHNSEQRSQQQNRDAAMKILKAKLWLLEEEKREDELRQARGEHKIAGWGNQIRNYVLHPYKLVKDLRTKVESHDPDAVLDGDLDAFINAEVRL